MWTINKMPYANSTSTYRIPYNVAGEMSSGQSNQRAAQIIDNQLLAASVLTGQNGIIQEGVYSATFSSGASSVRLVATGANYSMQGLIAGVYIQQNSTLSWTGIPDNKTAYLYVISSESNLYSSGQFSSLQSKLCQAFYNTTGVTPPNGLLVGIATTTGSAITLNTSGTASDLSTFSNGKPYIYPYGQHRLQIPMDHPYNSVINLHVDSQAIESRHIKSWDGITSGSSITGTGIGTTQIKAKAITSQLLAANLSVSGLTILNSAILSGTTLYPKSPTLPNEVTTVQFLYSVTGPISSNVAVLQGNQSGIQSQATSTQNQATATQSKTITLEENQSGIQNQINQIHGVPPYSMGDLSGLTTAIVAHGPLQSGRLINDIVVDSPIGGITGSKIEFWFSGSGVSDRVMSLVPRILIPSDSGTIFPKTLLGGKTYIMLLKNRGDAWMLSSLVGGF